jgi:hypothetical protein
MVTRGKAKEAAAYSRQPTVEEILGVKAAARQSKKVSE